MELKQAIEQAGKWAMKSQYTVSLACIVFNILHFWLICAIGHFIPTLHWTFTPYTVSAVVWECFVLAITFIWCAKHWDELED